MAVNYLYFGTLAMMLVLAGCISQPTPIENSADTAPYNSGDVMNEPVDTPAEISVNETVFNETPNESIEGNTMGSEIREIAITARQFAFEPSTITVKKGEAVKLTITSIDVTHGFALIDFGISETIEPGKTTVIEFTPDKAGEYTFFCNVYCGSGHSNVRGKLIVTK